MDAELPVHPRLDAVPVFPLPGVVLFPRAVMPLHIFEERYKAMTRDVLAGNRTLAMSLLLPGWEKHYYSRPPIDPVVCVGTILSHEKLPDGRYNFLLHGLLRARVEKESADSDRLYRVAKLQPLEETAVLEIDLCPFRERLDRLFDHGALGDTAVGRQLRPLLHGTMTTAEISDVLAFTLFEDAAFKQKLLAEGDVKVRVGRIVSAIERMLPILRPQSEHTRASLN